MKKIVLVFCGILLLIAAPAAEVKADVDIQVGATHEPTPEFKKFTAKFLSVFGELYVEFCAERRPAIVFNAVAKELPTIFYLIEKRDQGKWLIGLCEPKKGERNAPLDFSSAKFSFEPPIWVIEGVKLKNLENIPVLAREAAQTLINKLGQKEI